MLLADVQVMEWLGPPLTGVVVAGVLGYLGRAAQLESALRAGERRAIYPKALKWNVVVLWGVMAVSVVYELLKNRGEMPWNTLLGVGVMLALVVPLHLESFGVTVTWDETMIYTRSPWRRARAIPLEAVRSVDYSALLQWHRLHTAGYGIVRLHDLLGGKAELLELLREREKTPPNEPSAKGG